MNVNGKKMVMVKIHSTEVNLSVILTHFYSCGFIFAAELICLTGFYRVLKSAKV